MPCGAAKKGKKKDGTSQRNSIIEKDISEEGSRSGPQWKENREAGVVDVE